jgi:hypothetical protein
MLLQQISERLGRILPCVTCMCSYAHSGIIENHTSYFVCNTKLIVLKHHEVVMLIHEYILSRLDEWCSSKRACGIGAAKAWMCKALICWWRNIHPDLHICNIDVFIFRS